MSAIATAIGIGLKPILFTFLFDKEFVCEYISGSLKITFVVGCVWYARTRFPIKQHVRGLCHTPYKICRLLSGSLKLICSNHTQSETRALNLPPPSPRP
ncbi:hypothetical protein ACKLNO_10240 [Neisseriaceae bacterium B1]